MPSTPPTKPIEIKVPFPRPLIINGRQYWQTGAIRRWCAAKAGDPPPEPRADDENLITTKEVRVRLGNVSAMWIYRKLNPAAPPPGEPKRPRIIATKKKSPQSRKRRAAEVAAFRRAAR